MPSELGTTTATSKGWFMLIQYHPWCEWNEPYVKEGAHTQFFLFLPQGKAEKPGLPSPTTNGIASTHSGKQCNASLDYSTGRPNVPTKTFRFSLTEKIRFRKINGAPSFDTFACSGNIQSPSTHQATKYQPNSYASCTKADTIQHMRQTNGPLTFKIFRQTSNMHMLRPSKPGFNLMQDENGTAQSLTRKHLHKSKKYIHQVLLFC